MRMWGLAAAALLTMAGLPQAARADPAMEGHWQGAVRQGDGQHYNVSLTLDGAAGRIDYLQQHCGGRLVQLQQSEGFAAYREQITYGGVRPDGSGCVNGGTVRLRRQGDVLIWTWRSHSNDPSLSASAILRR